MHSLNPPSYLSSSNDPSYVVFNCVTFFLTNLFLSTTSFFYPPFSIHVITVKCVSFIDAPLTIIILVIFQISLVHIFYCPFLFLFIFSFSYLHPFFFFPAIFILFTLISSRSIETSFFSFLIIPFIHHLSSILFTKPPLLFFRFIYLLSSISLSRFLSFLFLPSPLSIRHRSSIDLFSSPTFTLFSHFRRSILLVHHPSLPSFVLSLSCFYPPSLPHPLLPVIVRHTMYSSQHPSPIPSLR